MPIFEITSDRIVPFEATSFEAVGVRERSDLQRLLKAQIDVVSPDLLVIAEGFRDWEDSDLEKLYTYGRFLLSKLPRRATGPKYDFEDDVTLKFYRLQKISEGQIKLETGEPGEVKGPTAVGTSKGESPKVELSSLIEQINDRFGTEFTPADQLFFTQIREEAVADESLRQAAAANTIENFRYVFDKALEGLFIDRMEQNEELFAKFMNNKDFQRLVTEQLSQEVYSDIRDESADEAA